MSSSSPYKFYPCLIPPLCLEVLSVRVLKQYIYTLLPFSVSWLCPEDPSSLLACSLLLSHHGSNKYLGQPASEEKRSISVPSLRGFSPWSVALLVLSPWWECLWWRRCAAEEAWYPRGTDQGTPVSSEDTLKFPTRPWPLKGFTVRTSTLPGTKPHSSSRSKLQHQFSLSHLCIPCLLPALQDSELEEEAGHKEQVWLPIWKCVVGSICDCYWVLNSSFQPPVPSTELPFPVSCELCLLHTTLSPDSRSRCVWHRHNGIKVHLELGCGVQKPFAFYFLWLLDSNV